MTSEVGRKQVVAKWQETFARVNSGQPGISGLMSFTKAWIFAREFLYPRDINDPAPPRKHDMQEARAAFELLSNSRRLSAILETFIDDMRGQQYLITADVMHYMSLYEETSDPQTIAQLVRRLMEWHKAWSPVQEFGFQVLSAFDHAFQDHLFSILPASFPTGFKALIASTLAPYCPEDGSKPSEVVTDMGLWSAFEHLGLLDRYESLVSSVCYEQIEEHILLTYTGEWQEPMLAGLREWMSERVVPWMLLPYARGARNSDEAKVMLQGVGSRFDFHMCKTLCDLRTKEIFDIIIDYPDSMGALQDLKECLLRVDQRSHLVSTLRKANKTRLLHPGADTKDILTQYVSIMRCLRHIDPPGVLLYKVAEPIRRYLRNRPDTIRCIVASLVGDGDSGDSLVDDSEPVQPLAQMQNEDYSDPNWEPEPIDAGPDFRTNRPSDVISTLVSIYDSKDLFVKELQVLLAQRLLAIQDGNFEHERRNIEILKVRFGEAPLQVCEVMLKDMTDSKRTDQHVQAQKASVLHPTIISRHFWPPLQGSKMSMPPKLQEIQEQYAKEFTAFKPDKKLHWLHHLGTVTLELELEDRTIEANVPPLEAAIIGLFEQQGTWTVLELMASVGSSVDRAGAMKALNTWMDLGVLKEEGDDRYRLLEIAEEGVSASRPVQGVVEEEPVMTTVQQQAEQMKVFWRFIEAMLMNLGSLPLDRIQVMLKLAPGYDRTIDQLAMFMEAARREGLVTVNGGMWRLNR